MSTATEADVLKAIASVYGCDESVFNTEKKPAHLNVLKLFEDNWTRIEPGPENSKTSEYLLLTIALCDTAKQLVKADICTAEALTQGECKSLDGPAEAQAITLHTEVVTPVAGKPAPLFDSLFKVTESAGSNEVLSLGITTNGESRS